jgi:hypothetical protein
MTVHINQHLWTEKGFSVDSGGGDDGIGKWNGYIE